MKSNITRFDGTSLTIAEGVIGDETALIKFRLAGSDADKI